MNSADEQVTPWRRPPLSSNAGEPGLAQIYAEELATLRTEAQRQGYADGIAQAHGEVRARVDAGLAELDVIVGSLQRPFEELGDDVVEELGRLAGHIAKQLLRRELKTSPQAIIGVIREAVASLPDSREGATVYLHPEDLSLVEELTDMTGQERGWELLSDPAVARGDCMVVRDASLVDASLDERARAAMLQVLGGERTGDNIDE